MPKRKRYLRFKTFEYLYYFMVFYSLMGEVVGISFGFLGIGMYVGVAGLCILRRGSRPLTGGLALAAPVLAAGSFMAIQIFAHQESVMDGQVRPFLSWMLALIIIRSLSTRPGFIRRFGVAAFLIGLSVLPFLELSKESRAGLAVQTGLSNPNDLAEWFGFCALVFTIRSLETRRMLGRWVCAAVALFSLSIIGLTVSRGSLVAFAVAMVVTFRTRLRRAFVPLLFIIAVGGTAFGLGVFDSAIAGYSRRGLEDTGRLGLWAMALPRIEQSPYIGVGVSKLATSIPGRLDISTPHNGFLFFALAAGFVPMLFFLGHWIVAFYGARRGSIGSGPDAAYLLPLFVYAFVAMQWSSQGFTAAWSVVSSGVCLYHFGMRNRSLVKGRPPRVSPRSPRKVTVMGREF